MPYFLVTLQADHGISQNTQTRTFAVSETPAKFWLRNARDLERTILLHSEEIDAALYSSAKELNPPNAEYYWRLSIADAGTHVGGDDSEEDDLGGS